MQTASLKRTTTEKAQAIIDLYAKGHSQLFIEKELKVTRKTIRTVLLSQGILRTKEEQSQYIHLTSTLREDAFDIIDDSSAYWLGFLYADGYITNPETTTAIGIMLKEADINQIEKFKEFLKAPNEIYHTETVLNGKTYKSVKIKIGSQKLHKRLSELGFTHTKSKDAVPPEFLKYNRHFWRGVIDGDGYIGIIRDSARIHLCGTIDTVESFKNFVIHSGIVTDQVIRKENDKDLYTFYIASEKAKVLGKILYDKCEDYLDRKLQAFKDFPEGQKLFLDNYNPDLAVSE